jgi:hypothetical protein
MRVVSGLMAVSVLLVLAQPALAVCVIRGGVTSCIRDTKYKYPHVTHELEKTTPAATPNTDLKTIVLHPDTGENAWVLAPPTADGATVMGGNGIMAAACASSTGC